MFVNSFSNALKFKKAFFPCKISWEKKVDNMKVASNCAYLTERIKSQKEIEYQK